MEYIIHFNWDNNANVWIATSDNVPGLVLESGSFDALLERTRFAVPELLALDNSTDNPSDPFFSAENQARLRIAKERMERVGGTVHDLIEE